MRQSKGLVVAGSVRTSSLGVRHAVIAVVALVALVWAGIAFVQEAALSHRLGQQVSDLRKQNAQIAAQNAGYRKDVQALSNGADEEEARLNGFARTNEKTYLVASPSPSPPAAPSPSPSPKSH
jgi:cell division protein FtsB